MRFANIKAKDFKNSTPLHYAASNNPNIDVLKVLIENGAKVNDIDD